ncbi:hypothetical protein PIIN_09913 [Serendipita indica DSM 11827]|uniref:Metallo-beta-lactamase domain-containing protein n=1 Tax=Serendipita indica (strain DSM 11827) TaxID=1109443 RepID=G4TX74_SERID|nr:hypothetical protein PIIN_09913 [Serendipita indica DSM 11827]
MVILKHLNEDTSWLIQFTFNSTPFNILIDPWLKGPQTDYWKLFSTQWHAIPSCVEHISDLGVQIHAVVISHEWTDHCHKATLLEVEKEVPVYATDKAADIIRSWKHFDKVYNIPPLAPGQSWKTSSINGLPKQLGIARAASSQADFQYYHSASNGIEEISALLHGLHEVTNPKVLGGKLNLGGRNAVQVAHNCKPKLWIGTHDEVKVGKGLVSKVLKRRIWSVEEALKEEGLADSDAKFRVLRSGEQVEFD